MYWPPRSENNETSGIHVPVNLYDTSNIETLVTGLKLSRRLVFCFDALQHPRIREESSLVASLRMADKTATMISDS